MKQDMSVGVLLQKPDGSRVTAIRFETTISIVYEHVDDDTPIEITQMLDGNLTGHEVIAFRDIIGRTPQLPPGAVLAISHHAEHDALLGPPPSVITAAVGTSAATSTASAQGIALTITPGDVRVDVTRLSGDGE